MSTEVNLAISDAQQQDPGSALVILYELEYDTGSFLYFYPAGVDSINISPPQEVQFRSTSGAINTYSPFPIEAEGFDVSSDGSYSRPSVRMANIESTIRTEINGNFESLIGKKLIRRTTFQRYLVGYPGDSTPPVELPKLVYIIDRIKSKNVLQVEFELSTPFDLAGVQLPRRVIVGGACPFKYKGARTDTINYHDRVGGCNWAAAGLSSGEPVFLTRNDEYILPPTVTYTAWAGSATGGQHYSTVDITPDGFYKVTSSGVLQAANRTNYWQAIKDNTSTPSDSDTTNWRRVWAYQNYSSSGQYDAYKDQRFSEYVYSGGNLWRVKITQDSDNHATLTEGPNWTAGDICGKTLKSCRLRFYSYPHDTVTGAIRVSPAKGSVSLPFGGFPGALQQR